ncbi:MAG: response regulator transcription factor [Polyangiaceae bacterium]|nr:response regulator transcription factor [Myxococcales bacterium]MCB9584955.1 response regulator transcription factor [Polyangiaceae bacterium]MCB9607472.1 response regulator transcription factor [Polyangiaceae bacterium]
MRVFIVEDDRRLLESVAVLLDGEPTMQVSGRVSTTAEALAALPESNSDILLTDLGLPDGSGVDLIRAAKRELPRLEIMAFTVFEDRDTVFAALKAGASGYLLKGSSPRELLEALGSLAQGGAPMSPRIARAVVLEFREEVAADPECSLTPRERDVLSGIDEGYSYKEIAQQLGLSPNTVHGYVKSMYEKLHARGRREALIEARRRGLV